MTKRLGRSPLVSLGAVLGAWVLAASACSSVPDPSPTEFIDYPTSLVLGKSRNAIERDLKPRKTDDDGWVVYTRTFRVRYDNNKAVEMIEKVPSELNCKEAAQWLGFERARTPILQKGRCHWPVDSPRHSLAKGVSGDLTLDDRVFQVKLH